MIIHFQRLLNVFMQNGNVVKLFYDKVVYIFVQQILSCTVYSIICLHFIKIFDCSYLITSNFKFPFFIARL
ncbi:hypothetical protein RhiirA4_200101 [Rhizophagus irregularis]|uniref:Uncharacterized protein n=1 Tax=Rhizophagus irregularis TaxID=588596 RepID=A0A2I1GK11_9GLOM|nr:hypothetical protein RhiirA4_200101 [Rhizophagus irregularis]